MLEERQPPATQSASPGSVPPSSAPADPLADPRALQILTTEHWSLLASRSLAYNESFSRAGMFLSFLSASLIVIGFLLASDTAGGTALTVVAVLLVADLFIGVATLGRLFDASSEELQAVRGMNRIRHAYRDMAPDLEPYFVSGFHDDARGVLATYGADPGATTVTARVLHGLTTTTGMIGAVDGVIGGALAGVVLLGLGAGAGLATVVGVAVALLAIATFAVLGMRTAMRRQAAARALFPTPD